MYYPTIVQPTSAIMWPDTRGVANQQQLQSGIPAVYYQMPVVPMASLINSNTGKQQPPETISTTTVTKKTTTSRVLDPTSTIQRTVSSASSYTTDESSTDTSTAREMTTIREESSVEHRSLSCLSKSSNTTVANPEVEITQAQTIVPPQIPIQTGTLPHLRHVIHKKHRSYAPSHYHSTNYDYHKRKQYKNNYKYRHYYCCNLCKGRCDLHNRSYSCCEWFYGCPVWAFILLGLLFLALLITFLTLFALQPSINSTRYSDTAETRLVNRTEILYGFYQNCGYEINATSNTPTTLILCTNTATTTTSRIELSSFYTVISQMDSLACNKRLIIFAAFFFFHIYFKIE